MDKSATRIYGNKVRTRVCGLCWEGGKLLMVNHAGLYRHDFWAPPGGGVEFGQPVSMNLAREFKEETGLKISVGEFQFACEFIQLPLHAIELFFAVTKIGGKLETGVDPEMGTEKQIIKRVRFLSVREIMELPARHRHGLFEVAETEEKIHDLRGYLKI